MKLTWTVVVFLIVAAAACTSCKKPPAETPSAPTIERVKYLEDTIGQRAFITGTDYVTVEGYGLVVGLAGTGGTTYPQRLRDRMVKEIARHKVPNPEGLLADPNTAVVVVGGMVPPGALKNERFDLLVTPVPGSGTTSLEGGTLLEVPLAQMEPSRTGTVSGQNLAEGVGEIFVSPFTLAQDRPMRRTGASRPITPQQGGGGTAEEEGDESDASARSPERQSDPRIGRILGGGRTLYTRNFFLRLMEPSERTADMIIRHINARFPDVAKGNIDPSIIDLRVPAQYAFTKDRFLSVVGAIYLIDTPFRREERMRMLIDELRKPGADARSISTALEAFGRSAIPILEPLLEDKDPQTRFYAAQTLAFLGSLKSITPLEKFLTDDESPYQVEAAWALAALPNGAGSAVLRAGLAAKAPTVRIASYMALGRVAPHLLRTIDISGKLELGIVSEAKGDPFVFVTRHLKPRVVVFGDAQIEPPLLVSTPRLLATVREGEDRINLVSQKLGATNTVRSALGVADVVLALTAPTGSTPTKPRARALDMSYSDAVGLLYQAWRQGAMRAPIVLEPVRFVGGLTPAPEGTPGGEETDIVIPPK